MVDSGVCQRSCRLGDLTGFHSMGVSCRPVELATQFRQSKYLIENVQLQERKSSGNSCGYIIFSGAVILFHLLLQNKMTGPPILRRHSYEIVPIHSKSDCLFSHTYT